MNQIKREFIDFVKSLASNEASYESWRKYAVHHYLDNELEAARIDLVRICNDDESIGNEIWPLTIEATNQINQILVQLESSHS